MFLIVGILVHVAIGVGMRLLLGWRFGVVATIFAAKEFGELKYRLPGSITTWDKNLAILTELLTNGSILAQWLLPAMAAGAVGFLCENRGIFNLKTK